MKNIAFIINSLAVGGNERSVSLLSEVISKNYIVYIIVFDGSHIAYNYDGELIDINEPSRTGIFNKILVYIRRIKKVNKIIKDKQIDIIYAFTNSFNAISHWRFHNVKKIVACRDCGDLIRKTSCYAHMLKTSDHMVFNSEFMRTYFLGKYPQYNDKCSVIYNIVDTHYIESVCSEKLSPEHEQFYKTHAVVVAVGRFCKEKGFNHLVRSFVMLRDIIPSAGLVIVGNGELFPLIEKMVSVCKYKDDILLVGAQKNPYKYMMLAKVFALSSITEGFPNVLLEAMACGLPVVATDCTSGCLLYTSDAADE